MKDYSFIYIRRWNIVGFEDYGFLEDKRLFNYKTNRFSKKVVIGYSVGFNLNGKFYTLKTMKENNMVVKVNRLSDNSTFKKTKVLDLYNYLSKVV